MLSKKDKLWLETVIQNKIQEALTVKVRFEKRRDTSSGQPLAVPEIEVKDVYLPAHWVEFLPFYEASIRGSQETVDHLKNNMFRNTQMIEELLSTILIENKNQTKLLSGDDVILIENNTRGQ